ncbi:hypothetical protein HD593_001883 [Nonomuraea rubra]|uniref:Uncharacterized protein n=1 Tax=Nonomuraea rubra TaxID=46180 RepID=A0A7X0NP95_9ACTN|nr:hypothetical protein [Nonomuraea rubra]
MRLHRMHFSPPDDLGIEATRLIVLMPKPVTPNTWLP